MFQQYSLSSCLCLCVFAFVYQNKNLCSLFFYNHRVAIRFTYTITSNLLLCQKNKTQKKLFILSATCLENNIPYIFLLYYLCLSRRPHPHPLLKSPNKNFKRKGYAKSYVKRITTRQLYLFFMTFLMAFMVCEKFSLCQLAGQSL